MQSNCKNCRVVDSGTPIANYLCLKHQFNQNTIAVMSDTKSMFEMLMSQNEQEMEFMPIVPLGEDEMDEQEKSTLPAELPIIALRNTVLFPNVVLPITVAR